jgi:hypothetical protein
MGHPDDHFVVFDIGDGLPSLPEAPEENFIHEEMLDLILDQTGDLPCPEFGGVASSGEPFTTAISHCEKDLLFGEL